MKQIFFALLFLYHPESGEADRVESCTLNGEIITADFGHGWVAEFSASEYECVVVEKPSLLL